MVFMLRERIARRPEHDGQNDARALADFGAELPWNDADDVYGNRSA